MTFYLGLSQPSWIGRTPVPICLARPRLVRARSLRRITGPYILDSGGFTELAKHGRWSIDAATYAADIRWIVEQLGRPPDAVACQDLMCEPPMIYGGRLGMLDVPGTGLSVIEHQRRTVASLVELRELLPGLPVMPVLQGWTFPEYLRCAQMYADAGVDLTREPLVGVGSVCRRQHMYSTERIFQELHFAGITQLHAFGMKIKGLADFGDLVTTADSQAWGVSARLRPEPCPFGRRSEQNCLHRALEWRSEVLRVWPGHDTPTDREPTASTMPVQHSLELLYQLPAATT
jgi:hypothetical protein